MRLIDADYLYNKLVANKCSYDLVLQMVKDEPTVDVLDKIRAEIEKAIWEDVVVSLDGTDEIKISRLEPDDVFEIIDKYKS